MGLDRSNVRPSESNSCIVNTASVYVVLLYFEKTFFEPVLVYSIFRLHNRHSCIRSGLLLQTMCLSVSHIHEPCKKQLN